MIKAVIFDIDNTMYDYDAANRVAIRELEAWLSNRGLADALGCRAVYAEAMEIIKKRTGIDCAANHNRLLRFQCMLELLKVSPPGIALEMYHVYWDTLIGVMRPEPGLHALLEALKEKGLLIGIGSNMTAYIQYKKLEKLGVLDQVDRIVVSEETGLEKPAPRFFQICVEKMGCAPEECIFIGDSVKHDVLGAITNGLHGVWYYPREVEIKEMPEFAWIRSYSDCLKDGKIRFSDKLIIE